MTALLIFFIVLGLVSYSILWGMWYESTRGIPKSDLQKVFNSHREPPKWWQEPIPAAPTMLQLLRSNDWTTLKQASAKLHNFAALGSWLFWLAMRYLRKFETHIRVKVAQLKEAKRLRAENEAAERRARWEASPEGRYAIAVAKWQEEVDALREEMCKVPPEQMLAKIKIYEWQQLLPDKQDLMATHRVDLFLVPSEEERAIILKFDLDSVVLESEPLFSQEQLAQMEEELPEKLRAMSEGLEHQDRWVRETFKMQMRRARGEVVQTAVHEYFDFPYTTTFYAGHAAHRYAAQLRDDLLPKIRGLIEDYRMRRSEETFNV